ncbi:hypothetical protein PHLCEN_2v8688 [Hermanssonia centrifuga]|uniref:FAD-binding PCMH-type domain-containing protein n=1 Tax=Hermanssonia centrifuga TaxID=98765 RepID=A0A2R6NTN9_9APHY|nr:hypothetical protein PHLCEN_2v8688 [Hermanssonia centrifuga]
MAVDITTLFPGDQVLTPDDGKLYEESIRRWAENAERKAKYIVLPKSAEDVSKAVRGPSNAHNILFATQNDLEIAIKGGGHSCSGASSSKDLVIDLRHLNSVTVDANKQLITVGGGADWAAVDEEAAKYGLATVGGTVNHTGVGGLTVGGGYGWLTAKYGLTIDNLLQAQVVIANGDILTCNESENSDLFWAIRGAGSNFGPVTSFVFRGYPQTNEVWSGLLVYTPPQLEALINATATWTKGAGEDESCMIFIASPPPDFEPCLVVLPFFNGSAEEGKKKFSLFYDVGPVADMTKEMPYKVLNSIQNPMATHGDRKLFKASTVTLLDSSLVQHLFNEYCKLTTDIPETKGAAILLELHPFQKLMSVPTSAMAFASRGPFYNMNIVLRWKNSALDAELRTWASGLAEHVHQEEKTRKGSDFDGAQGYSNYGLGDERVRDVFGENYDRLRDLKAKYDPNSVFHKWFPIVPKG